MDEQDPAQQANFGEKDTLETEAVEGEVTSEPVLDIALIVFLVCTSLAAVGIFLFRRSAAKKQSAYDPLKDVIEDEKADSLFFQGFVLGRIHQKVEDAEKSVRDAIAAHSDIHGPQDVRVAADYTELGRILTIQKRVKEAEQCAMDAQAILKSDDVKDLPGDHVVMEGPGGQTITVNHVAAEAATVRAIVRQSQGNAEEALSLYRQAMMKNPDAFPQYAMQYIGFAFGTHAMDDEAAQKKMMNVTQEHITKFRSQWQAALKEEKDDDHDVAKAAKAKVTKYHALMVRTLLLKARFLLRANHLEEPVKQSLATFHAVLAELGAQDDVDKMSKAGTTPPSEDPEDPDDPPVSNQPQQQPNSLSPKEVLLFQARFELGQLLMKSKDFVKAEVLLKLTKGMVQKLYPRDAGRMIGILHALGNAQTHVSRTMQGKAAIVKMAHAHKQLMIAKSIAEQVKNPQAVQQSQMLLGFLEQTRRQFVGQNPAGVAMPGAGPGAGAAPATSVRRRPVGEDASADPTPTSPPPSSEPAGAAADGDDVTCAMEGCSQPGTSRCAGCKKTRYCGSDHQKAHWATHKAECKSQQKSE